MSGLLGRSYLEILAFIFLHFANRKPSISSLHGTKKISWSGGTGIFQSLSAQFSRSIGPNSQQLHVWFRFILWARGSPWGQWAFSHFCLADCICFCISLGWLVLVPIAFCWCGPALFFYLWVVYLFWANLQALVSHSLVSLFWPGSGCESLWVSSLVFCLYLLGVFPSL